MTTNLPIEQLKIIQRWLNERRQQLHVRELELTEELNQNRALQRSLENDYDDITDAIEQELERSPCL